MNIVEFAENICGVKLLPYQKEVLKKINDLPPGSKLVYCNGIFHVIKDKENEHEL